MGDQQQAAAQSPRTMQVEPRAHLDLLVGPNGPQSSDHLRLILFPGGPGLSGVASFAGVRDTLRAALPAAPVAAVGHPQFDAQTGAALRKADLSRDTQRRHIALCMAALDAACGGPGTEILLAHSAGMVNAGLWAAARLAEGAPERVRGLILLAPALGAPEGVKKLLPPFKLLDLLGTLLAVSLSARRHPRGGRNPMPVVRRPDGSAVLASGERARESAFARTFFSRLRTYYLGRATRSAKGVAARILADLEGAWESPFLAAVMAPELVLFNSRPTLQALRATGTSILLLGGADDRIVPPAALRELAAVLADGAGSLHYENLSGVGHFLIQEAPEQTAALITAFLAEIQHAGRSLAPAAVEHTPAQVRPDESYR